LCAGLLGPVRPLLARRRARVRRAVLSDVLCVVRCAEGVASCADPARVIVGLSYASTRAHLARATLEASAFQTAEVLRAAHADSGVALQRLLVDGGLSQSDLTMQLQ